MKFRPETTLGQLFFRLVDTRCQALVTDEICILVLTELGVTFVTDEHIRFVRNLISRYLADGIRTGFYWSTVLIFSVSLLLPSEVMLTFLVIVYYAPRLT